MASYRHHVLTIKFKPHLASTYPAQFGRFHHWTCKSDHLKLKTFCLILASRGVLRESTGRRADGRAKTDCSSVCYVGVVTAPGGSVAGREPVSLRAKRRPGCVPGRCSSL